MTPRHFRHQACEQRPEHAREQRDQPRLFGDAQQTQP
jgi:hypothetical protein